MGKKTKVGKARKDKFYFLAKETGFRSRSAFKLIQLNRRFGFLNSSKVLVDLCAAPGGWLQVAAKEMPVASEIIGVDLVPIQPIPRVKTFMVDITTEKCKQLILQTLANQKADVVLHDGSPNVGTAWSIDEFTQANLCLQAFVLASEVLRKGGWFITKVFRSRDYEPLKWVLSQFFRTLRAVKPEASRIESAEIFLVGQFYLAPDHIDPKFLDIRYVFGEVEVPKDRATIISTLFKDSKKKRKKAEGYADGDCLYHELKVSEFISTSDPLQALANTNKIVFDLPSILNHSLTTNIIKEDVKDIQVLGKGDIRQILKWRKKLVDELTPKTEPEPTMETEEPKDEDEVIEVQVQRLIHEEEKQTKKKLKRVRKAKMKLAERLVLKMDHVDDHIDQDDDELFHLSSVQNIVNLEKAGTLFGDTGLTGVDEMTRQSEQKTLGVARQRLVDIHRSAVEGSKRAHFDRRGDTGDWDYDDDEPKHSGDETGRDDLYFSDNDDGKLSDADADHDEESMNDSDGSMSSCNDQAPPPPVDVGKKSVTFASQHTTTNSAPKSSADEALVKLLAKTKRNPLLVDLDDTDELVKEKDKVDHWLQSSEIKELLATVNETDEGIGLNATDDEDSGEESDTGKSTATGRKKKGVATSTKAKAAENSKDNKETKRRLKRPLTIEEKALALRLIRSAKSRRELLEDGYHRGRFFEDPSQLPDWFVEDERRHMHRPQLIKKEDLAAVDTRPPVQGRTFKKVEEAKARKKHRLAKQLKRVRAKAENISDEVTETEKWQQIKGMYKKAGLLNKKRRPLHVIVNTKAGARNPNQKAPRGAKVKILDRRMKADLRAEKRGSKSSSGKSGGRGKAARRPVSLLAHKPRNGGRRKRKS